LNQPEAISQKPLVSVIIPAYKAAPYIKEALDSVFAQSYRNFEVIVINDGSPDTAALEEVLTPYRERVVYLKQENRGLAGARNTGLRAATGDLVGLLDADDIWMPNYLEEQIRYLEQHPEYDLVYCNAKFFGDHIHSGMEYMDVCGSTGEANASAIITRRCHVFVSVTARRDVLASLLFDESLRSCEDFDCWLRFTAAGHRIGYHRKVLVRYRKHRESLSANAVNMAEHSLRVMNNSLALWPPNSREHQDLVAAIARRTADFEIVKAKIALRQRRVSDAINHLEAANVFFKASKLVAVITALRLMPAPVLALTRLRGSLFRAYRD
jgi:glycosyltransferase involved in cell wall biosynthesis